MEKDGAPVEQSAHSNTTRYSPGASPPSLRSDTNSSRRFRIALLVGASYLLMLVYRQYAELSSKNPYGTYPKHDDPFHFLPCTNATVPPSLEDRHPASSWSRLFDPNPENWSWGNVTEKTFENDQNERDRFAGRGIYLCGYLDVPLDYHNKSDARIVRLAVTKFQVSGLARHDSHSHSSGGHKSDRTLVIEPGGPGGSGTSYVWRMGEELSKRLSDSRFDVLGWDPRGVNASLPEISCYPYDSDRDRWSPVQLQYREDSGSPRAQLEAADAMNDAVFHACHETLGDLPRFMTTALVARDVDQIRSALGESEVTGYFVSYGTGIGQTYANMFPSRVGRLILDGTEYVMDHRLLGGFGWTALDNVTNAWHDGFLGECIRAGPEHCALAKPVDGVPVTLLSLKERMQALMESLIKRPAVGFTSSRGPSLITYSILVESLYSVLYVPFAWPEFAEMLYELEAGNTTLAAELLQQTTWAYDPTASFKSKATPGSLDLEPMVICGDAYDAPLPPNGLDWWEELWVNMTRKDWIGGNSRFRSVFPCQHFTDYWPEPAEVYRGLLNHTLSNPVLLIAEAYDPATPLRNGRRLLNDMGSNARLVAHHGYGHSFRDRSACTDSIAREYILQGTLPTDQETACYADEKPYTYGVEMKRQGGGNGVL